ncbi:hypothetical protein L3X38_010018 [Prunus dulcis]|uniref:Non-ATPase subunit 9 n=1 Tax=Prunus dulcis TaxID=3755 RepID=A0AAD4ZED3_PRUDU|nr:hypothetical protein L3X38_010018 [Prunus dulcis]
MHSFQTRLKISIYKRKLFVFFPVRAPSEFDFSEQWFLFFPYLIKYKEKETRVVLSVKMVSQQQTKDSGSKKLGIVAPQDKSSKEMKSSKKMKFASSSAETESQTTISDDSKTGRGMSTMPRVVKRKLQKVRPIVEYNKMGKGIGQAHIEMQSYIGVLARSRVPLVDKKWSQIPKDVKEQIWEAVDMAFVVGQGGKKSVLASAAKKWKDFKSTLTRHYILPYTNDKEKLSHPPETYKFIEKAQWDAFVASRLSQDFESVHSQHAQIREKLEYNHRLSRKGYAGLEDELEETMPGVEIDRSTLWKRARQDKHGNIPDPKVAEKAKLIEVFGSDRDTFLLPEDITQFAGMEEIGATVVAVYMRHLHDVLKQAKMCSMVGFIDPATVSANSGTVAERSRLVAARLRKTDGEQIFMMPYNPGLVSLGFCF